MPLPLFASYAWHVLRPPQESLVRECWVCWTTQLQGSPSAAEAEGGDGKHTQELTKETSQLLTFQDRREMMVAGFCFLMCRFLTSSLFSLLINKTVLPGSGAVRIGPGNYLILCLYVRSRNLTYLYLSINAISRKLWILIHFSFVYTCFIWTRKFRGNIHNVKVGLNKAYFKAVILSTYR